MSWTSAILSNREIWSGSTSKIIRQPFAVSRAVGPKVVCLEMEHSLHSITLWRDDRSTRVDMIVESLLYRTGVGPVQRVLARLVSSRSACGAEMGHRFLLKKLSPHSSRCAAALVARKRRCNALVARMLEVIAGKERPGTYTALAQPPARRPAMRHSLVRCGRGLDSHAFDPRSPVARPNAPASWQLSA
jgi:hypothetical protein